MSEQTRCHASQELQANRSKMQVSETDVAIDIVGHEQVVWRFPRASRHQPAVMRGERIVIAGRPAPANQP
jgi:general L-amino acid transport system ATP-binding protein